MKMKLKCFQTKTERTPQQQIYMNLHIKRSSLDRRIMIPNRSIEMKDRMKSSGTDKHMGESKQI